MADFYKGDIPIIDPSEPAHADLLDPAGTFKGLVPRDYSVYPQEFLGSPDEMDVIPESEWDARFDEQESQESSLEHIYLRGGKPAFVNLDQNGKGYCWAHSTTHALMLSRLRDKLPLVMLSAYAVACKIKNFADEGGWCGLSAAFAAKNGIPSQALWPQQSMSRSNDNAKTWEDAATHKTTEEWRDLTLQNWEQKLTARQLATCGFSNIPAPSDFNWWGHSVCQVRWVRIEKGSWGPLILNSWLNWGRFGLGVLRGSQATADGAVAIRSTTPSAA